MKKNILLFLILITTCMVSADTNHMYPQPAIRYDTSSLIKQAIGAQQRYAREGQEKYPVLFYLFSETVPDVTLKHVFSDAKKINSKDIAFSGVVRGFSGSGKDALKKYMMKEVKAADLGEVEVKIDPFVFRELHANKVPALAYGACTTMPIKCEYYAVIYGDAELPYMVDRLATATKDPLLLKIDNQLHNFEK